MYNTHKVNFTRKKTNKMLLFKVNLACEEVKRIKGHTLAYLIPAQYDNLSDGEKRNQESQIANISAATSETKVKILQAISSNSKMIILGDHTPIKKSYFKMQKYHQKCKRNLVV